MKLTIKYFEKLGACSAGKEWYAANYPAGLTADELLTAIQPVNISWYVWLLGNSLACAQVPGADINAKDNIGRTPLHFAVYRGNKEIAKLLIAKGADINAKINTGRTPLHCAADIGNKEIAELLIAKGADVKAKTNIGRTPLHCAADKEIEELLTSKGAK